MREILFRGKRVDNGEWVYGNLIRERKTKDCFDPIMKETIQLTDCWVPAIQKHIPNNGLNYIYRSYEVVPETIGQYTGMIDRNGNKIFEGDIVAFVDFLNGWETECIGEVIFSEYGWHFTNSITESNMYSYEPDDIGIMGNVHSEVVI